MQITIGELAKLVDCSLQTLRYYEREGLVTAPPRAANNYRVYGAEHAERIRFIRHCRALDMTLDEVRSLLHFRDAPEESCGEVNNLLEQHISHVAKRIKDLGQLQTQLVGLRKKCASAKAAKNCGILQALTDIKNTAAQDTLPAKVSD